MNLPKEKIEILKKKLPELYELVLNVTSLLEGDLNYLKNISKDEIEKLNIEDPSSLNTDLKLAAIQSRANSMLDKLKQSINDCKSSLEISPKACLSDILSSKEFNENLTLNEKFIASAVAMAISKIKNQ